MYNVQVCELCASILVSKRYIDYSMVDECGNGVGDGDFLSSTGGTSRNEDTGIFAVKGSLEPESASCVPECLFKSGVRSIV